MSKGSRPAMSEADFIIDPRSECGNHFKFGILGDKLIVSTRVGEKGRTQARRWVTSLEPVRDALAFVLGGDGRSIAGAQSKGGVNFHFELPLESDRMLFRAIGSDGKIYDAEFSVEEARSILRFLTGAEAIPEEEEEEEGGHSQLQSEPETWGERVMAKRSAVDTLLSLLRES